MGLLAALEVEVEVDTAPLAPVAQAEREDAAAKVDSAVLRAARVWRCCPSRAPSACNPLSWLRRRRSQAERVERAKPAKPEGLVERARAAPAMAAMAQEAETAAQLAAVPVESRRASRGPEAPSRSAMLRRRSLAPRVQALRVARVEP